MATKNNPLPAPDEKGSLLAKKSSPLKMLVWLAPIVALLLSVATAGYFYLKYQEVKDDPKTAIIDNNQAETDRVLEALKRHLFIGEADAPTVARVDDPEKLKASNAEFYKDSQKGDYLIIYPKRAIVYRESSGQIINIAPIIDTSDVDSKDTTTPGPSQ